VSEPLCTITPSIEEGKALIKKHGYCVFLYSGDLSKEAKDNALLKIKRELGIK
jgi:hypothetical protein